MRIIRVNFCTDCPCTFSNPNPPAFEHVDDSKLYCGREYAYKNKDNYVGWRDITKYFKSETLPDNCPLENVASLREYRPAVVPEEPVEGWASFDSEWKL